MSVHIGFRQTSTVCENSSSTQWYWSVLVHLTRARSDQSLEVSGQRSTSESDLLIFNKHTDLVSMLSFYKRQPTLSYLCCTQKIELSSLWKILHIMYNFCYYPFRKRARSFNCKKLNPFDPRMVRAKFGWNWPGGSRE